MGRAEGGRHPRLGEHAGRSLNLIVQHQRHHGPHRAAQVRREEVDVNRLAAHLPIRSLVFDATRDDLEMLRGALAFAVAPGTSEQRRQLGIQSYPTTFFLEGTQVVHVARGLQSAEQLVTTLATLAGRQPLPVNAVAPDETCQVKT